MRKAMVAGLVIAALVMIVGQVVSTSTYRHVLERTQGNTTAVDVTLSARERFLIRFSSFWARYFIFLPVLILPVSVGGAMAIAVLFSRRRGGAA